jgi:hypothetical protein
MTSESTPPRPVSTHRAVWTKPRLAVRQLVEGDAARIVIAVAWLSGVLVVLQAAALRRSLSPGWGGLVLVFALTAGPLMGFAWFGLAGSLLASAGRLLGGKADASDTRVALACGALPELLALPLWPAVLATYGLQVLTTSVAAPAAGLLAFAALQAFLLGWAWLLRLAALSEVNGFSVWRALATVLLTLLAAVLAVAVAVFVTNELLIGPLEGQ